MSAEAKTAAEALLTDSLAADKDPVLVRALRGNTKAKDASKDEATAFLQSITLKAAAKMIEVASPPARARRSSPSSRPSSTRL